MYIDLDGLRGDESAYSFIERELEQFKYGTAVRSHCRNAAKAAGHPAVAAALGNVESSQVGTGGLRDSWWQYFWFEQVVHRVIYTYQETEDLIEDDFDNDGDREVAPDYDYDDKPDGPILRDAD